MLSSTELEKGYKKKIIDYKDPKLDPCGTTNRTLSQVLYVDLCCFPP